MNPRLPPSLIAAAGVTLVLFWLMQALVDRQPPYSADFVRVEPLERTELVADPPRPATPPPPEPEPAPLSPRPALAPAAMAPPVLPADTLALPQLKLQPTLAGRLQSGTALTAFTGEGGQFADSGGDGFSGADLVPISSARPKYPRSAIERELEGWVEVIFRIAADGRTHTVRVLDAEPRGVFEDAAVAAVSQWLYAPFYRSGRPLEREATQRLEFRLADVQPLFIWED